MGGHCRNYFLFTVIMTSEIGAILKCTHSQAHSSVLMIDSPTFIQKQKVLQLPCNIYIVSLIMIDTQ